MSLRSVLIILGTLLIVGCGGGGSSSGGGNSAAETRELATEVNELSGNWTAPDFASPSGDIEEMYFSFNDNGVVDVFLYAPIVGNCYFRLEQEFTITKASEDTFVFTFLAEGLSDVVEVVLKDNGNMVFEVVDSGSTLAEFEPSDVRFEDLGVCNLKLDNSTLPSFSYF